MNSVTLAGRLGKDPELKFTQAGKAVCKFSLATTERWKGEDGEVKEKTEWHNLTAWGKTAETISKFLVKGSYCIVMGKLETQKYDKDGQTHYATNVIVNSFEFGPKTDGAKQERKSDKPAEESKQESAYQGIDDDDIPF